jgi:hypothetical protein
MKKDPGKKLLPFSFYAKPPSIQLIDDLVVLYFNHGEIDCAIEVAGLGASVRALDWLVKKFIDKRQIAYAIIASSINPNSLLVEEIVGLCLDLHWVEGFFEASKLRGSKELIRDEIDELVYLCLDDGCFKDAIDAIKLGASFEAIDEAFQFLLNRRKLEYAIEVKSIMELFNFTNELLKNIKSRK